jgi:hypothetical protein
MDVTGMASGTLTFNPGATSATFTLAIDGDGIAEGNESVRLALGAPTGGATLGSRNRSVLTIVDDDVPTTGFAFNAASYTVGESGSATITVTRTSSTTAQSATVSTSDGTALDKTDYTRVSRTLTFGVGVTSQTVSVPILTDLLVEGDESLNLTLSNPTSGGTLAAQRRAVLTITDDDSSGSLEFASLVSTVGEAAGTATITVRRIGGIAGSVSVTVQTSNNTATSGGDYTAVVSTVLTFVGEQTSAAFTVQIGNDTLVEGSESLNLTLTNPTGGATLGDARRAVLTILDDEVLR